MQEPIHQDVQGEQELPPHVLTREYEDYLDWLENQRDDRTRRGRGRAFGLFSVVAGLGTLAGMVLHRVRTPRT